MAMFGNPKKKKVTPKQMRAQVAAIGGVTAMLAKMDPINGLMGTIAAGVKSDSVTMKNAVILVLGELLREISLNYEGMFTMLDTFSGELLMTVDVGVETEKDKELFEHITTFLAALMAKHEMGSKAALGMVRADTNLLIDITWGDKKPEASDSKIPDIPELPEEGE